MKNKKQKSRILIFILLIGIFIYHYFYNINNISDGKLLKELNSPTSEFIVKAYCINGGALDRKK